MRTISDEQITGPMEQPPGAPAADSAFLTQLLGAVQHSIIAVDRDERITYWNDFASRLYGYSRAEALGKPIAEVTSRGDTQGARLIMDKVWGGESWVGEYPVSHRDGTTVHARVRLFPMFGRNGAVQGIIGVSEDISVEVEARRAEEKSRERFELLGNTTSDAVWDWDAESGTLWKNTAYEALAGPTPEGLTAFEAWRDRVHPDDLATLLPHGSTTGKSVTPFQNEYRFLSRGQERYVRVMDRGFRVYRDDGKLVRVIGAMTDVSHVKAIEQAYQASEERFRLIFEESPLGIVVLDEQFHIVQTNGAYCRMLGYSPEEVTGVSIITLTHPDDQAGCIQLSTDLFQADTPFFRIEKRYVRRDGETVWAAVTAKMLTRREGQRAVGLALIEDITSQKRVRDALLAASARAEAASEAKLRFLAQISHEIRSPMNGVLGMLELLQDSPLNQEQREQVGAARDAASSLLVILEEILDLTRLEQQRLTLQVRAFSPVQLANEVISLFRSRAEAKGIQLVANHANMVPEEHLADPGRVRQILTNLVDNAVKFTSYGRVTVSVEAAEEGVLFVVEDSGIGIPESCIQSVFETFSAISAHTNASIGGTGLGLSISQRLARLMGGNIRVTSRLGEGSRFTLVLPWRNGQTLPEKSSPVERTDAKFTGRRVLIVEDNHINQRVAAGMLRRLDCDVDVAGNGVEGLQMALTNRYDAILMDAMMPVMDGFEATNELRRREQEGRRVPVIGLTALATEEDRQRCKEAGMDDYLSKPAGMDTLRAVLSRWLDL